MEESIGKLSKTLAKFCNRLETSCNGLKQSVERRPISLDSASTTFVQSVNRRVSVAATDLNMLESMTYSTVSFEELLGHCNEVLKKNQNDIFVLQDHIGYIPPLNFDEEEDEESHELDDCLQDKNFDSEDDDGLPDDFQYKNIDSKEDNTLLDDSLSLKKFGISDVSLATIASQAGNEFEGDEPDYQLRMESPGVKEGETKCGLNIYGESKRLLEVPRDDYESLPKYMMSLVSWEELLAAVEKMNSCIETKRIRPDTFQQAEIELLGLGSKTRSYLLLLIKMNRLCVATEEGAICYRIM